jgi:alginate O-acetyltransferase complex protein AlgJ
MHNHTIIRHTGTLIALALCLIASIAAAERDVATAFHEACAQKAVSAGDAMTIAGTDGWLFLANELRHVGVGRFWGDRAAAVSQATKPQDADPLPAILDFKRQLDALGIELILAPVPPKAIIYPDKVADTVAAPADGKAPARLDAVHQEFYKLLREKGVNVLDLTDDFLANRLSEEGPIYCRQDTHWSGLACNLAAKRIAEIVRQKAWYKDVAQTKFEQKVASVPISGDLWNALKEGARPERETLKLRMIRPPGGGDTVTPDRNSPVILLGDSHNLVFQAGGDMHASGAGLADQLAYELGFATDLLGVRGSGATPARINLYRRGSAEPGYFGKKKVIVWCFSAREFTESQGWRLVPVTK